MKRTLYDDLGVGQNATKQEIAKAYKNLAKRYHPDLQTNEKAKAKAEKAMIQINVAYETLKDDEKRREYDNQLLAEEEERRLARERARQQAEMNYNNANNLQNNTNYYIHIEYGRPIRKRNYDLILKVLLGVGIFISIFGIAMVIPPLRIIILDFYQNNGIFNAIMNILIAIYNAFISTFLFIKETFGKGTF